MAEQQQPADGRRTIVEQQAPLDLVVTRVFDAAPHLVFAAWTQPALFMRWWVPASAGIKLLSCTMDVRIGGGYRLEFGEDAANSIAFFGTYLDVAPNERLVWTNEEDADAPVTTVTFTAQGDATLLVMHERYPNQAGLDEALAGSASGTPEQFTQLDMLLASSAA